MNKEFVMRGQTASGETELLEFGGRKPGYGYILTEFVIYPSTGIGSAADELSGSITAGKTAVAPTDPNFNNEGLIGTAIRTQYSSALYAGSSDSIVNDTFLITQNLILMVMNSAGSPINWQCRFEAVKLNSSQEAVANYKQFNIFDD